MDEKIRNGILDELKEVGKSLDEIKLRLYGENPIPLMRDYKTKISSKHPMATIEKMIKLTKEIIFEMREVCFLSDLPEEMKKRWR